MGLKVCGRRFGLFEGRGVFFIGGYSRERFQGEGFAPTVGGCGWFEAEFGHRGDREIAIGPGEVHVRCVFPVALVGVHIGI